MMLSANRSWILVMAAVILCAGCRKSSKPPYSPEEALHTFVLPEDFLIELVAAEPQVVDPIAMAFDERSRLFVVEMGDYPISQKPLSRVKLLEDQDGDGRFERSTVFVDRLHFAHGVIPWKGGIIVTCAPDILYFADTDGDNRADVRSVILTGFARVNPQLRVNAPTYEMDNWIYVAYPRFGAGIRFKEFSDFGQPIHFPDHPEVPALDVYSKGLDLRFKPDQLKLEAVSGNSEFGLAFDERGNRFPSWNDKHVRHAVIEHRYLARNPYLAVDSTMQSISDHGDSAAVFPITENSHLEDIRKTSVLSQLGHFTSACGQSIYTGGNFTQTYDGAYFICEPVHNLVHADRLSPRGPTFVASRIADKSDFLASRDSWFMPVFTANGPDGALYVVDFYRKIVEHPEWIREGLVNSHDLFYAGNDRGRIYRVVYKGAKPGPKSRLNEAGTQELIQALSKPNRWWRLTAQRLLIERRDPAAVAALKDFLERTPSPEGQMHALWTLEGLDALNPELILSALASRNPEVREQAIRLGEGHLKDARVVKKLLDMTGDADDRVQFQLACTLGELPPARSFAAFKQIAARHLEDSWFQIAVLTAASHDASRWLHEVMRKGGSFPADSRGKELFLQRITSIIGARQWDEEIGEVVARLGKDLDEKWQVICLGGLADGLKKRGSNRKANLSSGGQRELLRLIGTSSHPVRMAALDVASGIDLEDSAQLRQLIQRASEVAVDGGTETGSRIIAIRMLGLAGASTSILLLERLLAPQEIEEIKVAAARALLSMPGEQTTEILLEKWNDSTSQVREAVLEGLFKEPARLHALLEAIRNGKVPALTLGRSLRTQLTRFPNEEIRRKAESLFAGISNDRSAVIEKYRSAVRAPGNVERGKEVYKKSCAKCHRIGETGKRIGPDLYSVSSRTREEILENILDPSANIVAGYEQYMVETRQGRVVTGVILRESATTVTLQGSEGEEDVILRSNIVSLRSSNVSAMPDGLEKDISVERMADLLAYLQSLNQASSLGERSAPGTSR